MTAYERWWRALPPHAKPLFHSRILALDAEPTTEQIEELPWLLKGNRRVMLQLTAEEAELADHHMKTFPKKR